MLNSTNGDSRSRTSQLLARLILFFSILGLSGQASAATLTVCEPGGAYTCDHPLVSDAIAAASNGDTIEIFGVVTEQDIFVSGITLTIQSGTVEPAIVQAHPLPRQATGRVFSVDSSSDVTFKNFVIRHGHELAADGFGAGIVVLGSVVLENMRVERNYTSKSGGGLAIIDTNGTGSAQIINSTIAHNTAVTSGGGILNDNGLLVMSGTTLFNNSSFEGGGLRARIGASSLIINSTFANNNAANGGGGIFNTNDSNTTVTSSTFSRNDLRAIQNNGANAVLNVQNSILANSGADGEGEDCAVFSGGTITDGGHNRIERPGGCVFDALSSVGGDEVLLSLLADHLGPTRTFMPLPGSNAIDFGSTGESVDQRDFGRPQGGVDDVGSVEVRVVDVSIPKVFSWQVEVDGVGQLVAFQRLSVLTQNTEVWLHTGTNQFDAFTPTDNFFDTYIGVLPFRPDAVATAVRFHATGEVYWRVIEEDGREWYYEGDVVESDTGPVVIETEWPPVVPRTGGAGSDLYGATVGVDITHDIYNDAYGQDPDTALAMIAYSLTTTNAIYRRQMGIDHSVGRVILRTDSVADPYAEDANTGNHYSEVLNQWTTVLEPVFGPVTDDFYTVICKPCSGLAAGGSIPGPSANGATGAGDFNGFFSHEVGHNWSLIHQAGDSPEGTTIMSGNDLLRFSPGNQVMGTLFRNDNTTELKNLGYSQVPVQPWASTDRLLFSVVQDVDAIVDVLANDHDANGDVIELVSVDSFSINPGGGTMALAPGEGANGRDAVRYTPPASPTSTSVVDRFTYTTRDSDGLEGRGYIFVRLVDFETDSTFSQSFDGLVDGTTRLEDGSWIGRYYWNNDSIIDNLPNVTNNALELVTLGTSSRSVGAYTLPAQRLDDGFSLSFRVRMTADVASARGVKINFGDTEVFRATSIYGGTGISARFTRGIAVELQNFETPEFNLLSSSTSDVVGYPEQTEVSTVASDDFIDGSWHDVFMVWDPANGVSLKYDGEIIFNQVLDPTFTPTAQDMITIAAQSSASTGSARIEIDDVVLGSKPPTNDDFVNAFTVTSTPVSFISTLSNATIDAELDSNEPDVWYNIPGLAGTAIVRVNTCGTFALSSMDTLISVHSDDGATGDFTNLLQQNDDYPNGLDPDACTAGNFENELDSAIELTVGPNEPLLIRVSKFDDDDLPGVFRLNVEITDLIDTDSDGVIDSLDNCTLVSNPNQIDTNLDGIGNRCDPDLNNDCLVNFLDVAQFPPAFGTSSGQPGYNPDIDFDSSGSINFLDFIVITGAYLGSPGPSATGCNPP